MVIAVRRAAQLLVGLLAFSASMALLIHAGQGAMPWDVLHQGLVLRTGLPLGLVVVLASLVVLALWIPLREHPGIGTLANVVVIGVSVDPMLALLDRIDPDPGVVAGVLMACTGIVLNGLATAAYIGVHLGPGPRDGLMTGLTRRTGWPVRRVKTAIEVTVVAIGWALGGPLGWATVAFALGVGPVVQLSAPWFEVRRREVVYSG
ncbi:membrane protein [Paraoerskovia sediminicola]|uniref:Membrane protein n=1 Tax=Paraoerskovia sediminicola TaxID=1138587 RepID=A0ABM8G576_9CELL|nr:hypothetical protein [Paraoerskovia sediminicola]BDZ43306.1 membrane protein [Paraoerskovia sediminicola]